MQKLISYMNLKVQVIIFKMIDDINANQNRNNNGILFTNDILPEGKIKSYDRMSTNDVFIGTLKSEIDFLRGELLSKDKIIELILKQLPRGNSNFEINRSVCRDNKFKRDKTFKATNDLSLINTVSLNNEFTTLNFNTENDVSNVIKSKRTIDIIGDSILKVIKSYQLKNKIKKDNKLYVE